MSERRDAMERVPPRVLPLVYFGFGALCLLLAFTLAAAHPRAVAGFFFHARMFLVVHLVALGWVTTAILGATYLVTPLALRASLPARRTDAFACGFVLVGIVGIAGHFWIAEGSGWATYSGLAWAAGLVLLGAALVAVRVWRSLRHGSGPRVARLMVALSYVNLMGAGILGLLLALNRLKPFLPESHLRSVFGHVHLAAVGWAVLMVMGTGYRLLPMFLPAQPVRGRTPWIVLALVQTGVWGLALAFFVERSLVQPFAVLLAAGLVLFGRDVAFLLRHPLPAPKKLRRPDPGMIQVRFALFYLLCGLSIGLFLVFTPEWRLDWIMAYGVCGLVGFLAQMILGMGMRLLPMAVWLEGYAATDRKAQPPSPHVMPSRALQFAALGAWIPGVPLLAGGLAMNRTSLVSVGAWLLFAGTLAAVVNAVLVCRHAFPRSSQDG